MPSCVFPADDAETATRLRATAPMAAGLAAGVVALPAGRDVSGKLKTGAGVALTAGFGASGEAAAEAGAVLTAGFGASGEAAARLELC
jgi:hypothetical protein